jgi:hypothetical protein
MSQELECMTVEPKNGGAGHQPLIIPPEESIWRKYSPNHEFPLSTLASLALHVFVVMLVVLFGALVFHWGNQEAPSIGTVYSEDDEGGGGGRPEGGANPQSYLREEVANGKLEDMEITNQPKLQDLRIVTDVAPNSSGDEDSKAFDRDFREKLPDPSKLVGPHGIDGGGDEGGEGDGHGPKKGDKSGNGPPRKKLRTDRWAIALSYSDGEGLYREWANFQAIILIPEGTNAAGQKQYRVFYDLTSKAPRGKLETVESMQTQKRIWFTDRNRESVAALANYLGYSTPPKFIAFFIPKKLEDELLRKELAYARQSDETKMQGYETIFRVSRVGDRFNAVVLEQKKKQ